MFKIIGGKPVLVPDDESITPELIEIAKGINEYLRYLSENTPAVRRIREQYRQGHIGNSGFDWYCDPSVDTVKETQ